MRNKIYLIIVVVVLIIGGILFVVVNNDDEGMMSSMMDDKGMMSSMMKDSKGMMSSMMEDGKEMMPSMMEDGKGMVSSMMKDGKEMMPSMMKDGKGMVSSMMKDGKEMMESESTGFMDSMSKSIGSMKDTVSAIAMDIPDVLQDSTSAIYKNGHLAMGKKDGSLKVVNSKGRSKTFSFHNKKINNLYIVKNRLVTSSDDGSLSVINLNTLMLMKQMKGHGKEVEGIIAFEDYIFSVSRDRTVKIWEISSTGLSRIIYY